MKSDSIGWSSIAIFISRAVTGWQMAIRTNAR